MVTQVTIFRGTGGGRYAEAIDVLERIGLEECGSAANAAVVCSRESPRYQTMLRKMMEEGYAPNAKNKATGKTRAKRKSA